MVRFTGLGSSPCTRRIFTRLKKLESCWAAFRGTPSIICSGTENWPACRSGDGGLFPALLLRPSLRPQRLQTLRSQGGVPFPAGGLSRCGWDLRPRSLLGPGATVRRVDCWTIQRLTKTAERGSERKARPSRPQFAPPRGLIAPPFNVLTSVRNFRIVRRGLRNG